MKKLKGLEAENYIKEAGYGEVSKKFLEKLFVLEDFVDGCEEEVPVEDYYTFIVNYVLEDAFLDDVYASKEDVELGLNEMAAFGISDVTIEVDNQGKVTIVE